jgi:DNA-binding response OmpR family regulator
MRILVVEDEREVAEVLRRLLESMGNACLLASDAGEADRLLEAEPVDAVTLDLGMPGTGGLEWLEAVATARPHLARKTLVITGQYLAADKVERLARCGAGVLAKPFTFEHLVDAVRAQLAHAGTVGGLAHD